MSYIDITSGPDSGFESRFAKPLLNDGLELVQSTLTGRTLEELTAPDLNRLMEGVECLEMFSSAVASPSILPRPSHHLREGINPYPSFKIVQGVADAIALSPVLRLEDQVGMLNLWSHVASKGVNGTYPTVTSARISAFEGINQHTQAVTSQDKAKLTTLKAELVKNGYAPSLLKNLGVIVSGTAIQIIRAKVR